MSRCCCFEHDNRSFLHGTRPAARRPGMRRSDGRRGGALRVAAGGRRREGSSPFFPGSQLAQDWCRMHVARHPILRLFIARDDGPKGALRLSDDPDRQPGRHEFPARHVRARRSSAGARIATFRFPIRSARASTPRSRGRTTPGRSATRTAATARASTVRRSTKRRSSTATRSASAARSFSSTNRRSRRRPRATIRK